MNIMACLKGMTIEKVTEKNNVTISWKQGSFLGIGGNASQDYTICEYKFPNAENSNIPVYINKAWDKPDRLLIDSKLRYGMNKGILFFVLDDFAHTPYQHRFIQSDIEKTFYAANEWLKYLSNDFADLSWVAGDQLRQIL